MKAQIITIGDELLSGQTINGNAAYIGEKLTALSINVVKTSTVGDDEQAIFNEFQHALENFDLVIATGGLGPTNDDVTRTAIIKFFDTDLIESEDVLNDIKLFFEKRSRELTETNRKQALVPRIAKVIRNNRGTAPGTWIERKGKIFISLPGVPIEMIGMMESFVIPSLQEKLMTTEKKLYSLSLMTTGIPESNLFDRLGDLDALLGSSKIAFLPNQFGVKIKLSIVEKDEHTASEVLSHVEQKIRALIGRYIYGKNGELIESVAARLLIERGLKIAVAESCTGGLISSRLTNISGSSAYFERALITYSNGAKVELLHVNEDLIMKYGAVSLEVARLMAEGVRAVSGTDIGLAVTGIMGPQGGTIQKPVGLVYIGICDDKICTAKEFRFGDDRLLNKDRASQAALEMLRRHLLGIPNEE